VDYKKFNWLVQM